MINEEDYHEELVSKLRRRRRQAAGSDEISAIDDERLHVRARLAELRSAKLAELKGEKRTHASDAAPFARKHRWFVQNMLWVEISR